MAAGLGPLPALAPCRSTNCPGLASSLFLRPAIAPRLQLRRATFIHRPRRPYTFTQLVTLSDGSTFIRRTTSPLPLYRATKDTRNSLLWQPSEKSLSNLELDEAGKLAAFRHRFGRAFDVAPRSPGPDSGPSTSAPASTGHASDDGDDGFSDLISGYAQQKAAGENAPETKSSTSAPSKK